MARPLLHPVLVVLAVLGSLACGGLPPPPSRGGPRWISLESEHFVLYTDRDEAGARRASAELERRLDALLALGFQTQGKLRLKVQVILPDDQAQFERFAGDDVRGLYVPQMLFRPLMLLSPEQDNDSWMTLNHELTHFIATQALGIQPLWLAEGLACYFESVRDDPNGAFVLGAVPRHYLASLRRGLRMPVAELLHYDEPDPSESLYANAWLLVHYLMSHHSAEFAAFQSALASGRSAAESWAEALPDLTPERLDALLERYLQSGAYLNVSRQLPARTYSPGLRVLSDADVYTLRAQLFAICSSCGDEAAAQVQENLRLALASEPDHLSASALSLLRDQKPQPDAEARTRKLVQAHPDDWLAWLLVARLQTGANGGAGCDAEVVPRLRALAPNEPYGAMLAGLCELRAGHSTTALELSQRAVQLQPWDSQLLLLRAAVLRTLGRCDELPPLVARLRAAPHAGKLAKQLAGLDTCKQTSSVSPP